MEGGSGGKHTTWKYRNKMKLENVSTAQLLRHVHCSTVGWIRCAVLAGENKDMEQQITRFWRTGFTDVQMAHSFAYKP